MNQATETAAAFLAALPPHECELTLTHNQHKSYYQTAAQAIEEGDEWYCAEDFADGEMQKCIDLNEIWTLQWYPSTPIGFHKLHASSLEAILHAVSTGDYS